MKNKILSLIFLVLVVTALSSRSSAQHLEFMGSCPLPVGFEVEGICAGNIEEYYNANHAYLACGDSGVLIYNVGQSANPYLEATFDTPGFAHRVAVRDSLLFVADDSMGLQIINVIDPEAPVLVSNFPVFYGAQCIAIHENYAFISNAFMSNYIIDISDPANPTLAGDWYAMGMATDFFVTDSLIYTLSESAEPYMIRLTITDISDIHNAVELGHVEEYTYSVAWGLSVNSHYAYVADMYSGLRIYDVSRPDSIALLSQYDLPGNLWDVYAGYFMALTISDEPAIQLFDIMDRRNPRLIMGLPLDGIASEISFYNTIVYIATNSSLQIIDVVYYCTCHWAPGDANANGIFNALDVAYLVNWLKGGPLVPPYYCQCPPIGPLHVAADANGSCTVNGQDITYMIRRLHGGVDPRACLNCPPGFYYCEKGLENL